MHINYFYEDGLKIHLNIIYRDGTYYINAPENVKVKLDRESEIKVIDSKTRHQIEEIEEFDYHLPPSKKLRKEMFSVLENFEIAHAPRESQKAPEIHIFRHVPHRRHDHLEHH